MDICHEESQGQT